MTDHQFSHLWSESRPRTACPGPARSKTPPAGVRAARPRRFYLQPWIPLKSGVRKVRIRHDSFFQKSKWELFPGSSYKNLAVLRTDCSPATSSEQHPARKPRRRASRGAAGCTPHTTENTADESDDGHVWRRRSANMRAEYAVYASCEAGTSPRSPIWRGLRRQMAHRTRVGKCTRDEQAAACTSEPSLPLRTSS